MMKSVFFVFCLALAATANHIAYLNYYDGSNCNGNPLATLPIFPGSTGDTLLCAIPNTNDCVVSLSGILAASGASCEALNYSDDGDQDDDEIFFTEDGVTNSRTFGECSQSGSFGGCSFTYTDNLDPVSLDDDDDTSILDDNDVVGFISYYGDSSCNTNLEFRAPVQVGGTVEFCSNDGSTTCSGDLRGVTLPAGSGSLSCNTNQYRQTDECKFLENENGVTVPLNYGVCTASSIFPNCRFEFSNNYGTTDQCTVNNDSNDNDDNRSDDDNNDDDDDSRSSSSGATTLTASFVAGVFALLI